MPRRLFWPVFAACLVFTVLPLWMGPHLPAVDAPQHLFLVHVLRDLLREGSPYAAIFEAGARLTYVTFYGSMVALSALFGEETALRLWLTLVIAGIPLGTLALVRAFGRSDWMALLACPLVYTDNFYWGLVSFLSAIAPTLAGIAWLVRTLDRPLAERRWAVLLAVASTLVVLTHAAAVVLPALAALVLIVATRTDRAHRARSLLGLLPAALLFVAWLVVGVGRNRRTGTPGAHWTASGSLLDPKNYEFQPIGARVNQSLELLANGFWSWADRPPVTALLVLVGAVAIGGVVRWWAQRAASQLDLRPLLLFGVGVACFLALPTDIRGYMYMIHPRYAQLAALLAIPVLPRLEARWERPFAGLAAAIAVWAGVNLAVLFHRFDAEARSFESVASQLPEGARIMHLVVDKRSAVATHAVYLHYAALAALRSNGVPSFSLALDPSFPVNYRAGAKPPAPEWEWQSERFSWSAHATWYDHYLVRGADAAELFGAHAGDVSLVAQSGTWSLYRRRTGG